MTRVELVETRRVELVETRRVELVETLDRVGDYSVPVDPMDDLSCESCQ